MSDPPAPALGALTPEQDQRLRGYAAGDDRWGWQNVKHSDVAAVMVLFDAQAARLAAVEQASRAWVEGGHFCMMECPTCQAVVDALAAPSEETGAADGPV